MSLVGTPQLAGDAAVAVSGLRVRIASREILKGVSAGFARGRVTAVIGPTGCGKTTLLRSLNRLNDQRPGMRVEGEILLEGQSVYHRGRDVRDLRRRIGPPC